MSNTDSFIDEVAEEVRRDKLYGYLRRYGWIAVLCVFALVGGAAWNEYRNAQAQSAAEATGDALMNALGQTDASARATAIAAIEAEGSAQAVTALLTASAQEEAGEYPAAAATLEALAANADIPEMYRDLAALKAAMMPSDDADSRRAALEILSQPGQPFRLLALEQLAYMELEAGETEAAISTLRAIEEDAAISQGLRGRIQTLMVALGEPIQEPVTE